MGGTDGSLDQAALELLRRDRLEEAAARCTALLRTDPGNAAHLSLLAAVALRQRRLEEAAALLARALSADRDCAPAYRSRMQWHLLNRQPGPALADGRRAAALEPEAGTIYLLLARLPGHGHRLSLLRRATRLMPDRPEVRLELAEALKAEAAASAAAEWRRAVALAPERAAGWSNLAVAAGQRQAWAESARLSHRALRLAPDQAAAAVNLGSANLVLGRLRPAGRAGRLALIANPGHAAAWVGLARVCNQSGAYEEAITAARRAMTLHPRLIEAYTALSRARRGLGDMEGGLAAMREALALRPDDPVLFSSMLPLMSFHGALSAEAVSAEHRRFGERFDPGAPAPPVRAAATTPGAVLRVGYLSPSLQTHVLSPNIEPVLRAHRRDRVQVSVYAHVPEPDAVTRRLIGLSDAWVPIHELSDDAVAARIRADGIDVLVHPIGHWEENRILVFARRPAPLQIAYLCQSPTTGMRSFDLYLADPWLNFDHRLQGLCVERVVELEHGFQVVCYDRAPPIGPPPCLARGHVTFGSFNNPAKISERSLELWAAALAAVPSAQFLIKGSWVERPAVRARFAERFARHGIAADRLAFMGWIAGNDYLCAHDAVDIMLDTLPFSGGRTTADALWMGVPVLSRVGDAVSGRLSYSQLCQVGVPELAAHDDAEFVAKAAALAADPGRLAGYRQTLRERMRRSPLMDAQGHVAELEAVYRTEIERLGKSGEPGSAGRSSGFRPSRPDFPPSGCHPRS